MTAVILLTILFICGLINSYFFPPSKLLAWLCSFLDPTKKKAAATTSEKKKKMKLISTVETGPADLETIFSTFDSNGDGFITTKELEESLRRLGLFAKFDEVKSMMERVDANGDGLIDLEEFQELYNSLEKSKDERVKGENEEEEDMDLKEAFDVFDGNRDGLITVEELGLVLKSLGLKQGEKEEDCRDMIRKVDLDGDGMVNYEEFKNMMLVKGGKLF